MTGSVCFYYREGPFPFWPHVRGRRILQVWFSLLPWFKWTLNLLHPLR